MSILDPRLGLFAVLIALSAQAAEHSMVTPARGPAMAQVAQADDWQSISPAEAGFAPDLSDRLDAAVRRGELANLHAVIVARHGKLVLERYYAGHDERRGEPLGVVTFGPAVKHDLRSISKSVVGLLYGIAVAEGRVPAVDQPIVDQFPAYADLAADPQRRRLTIAHVLSMTLGTEWDETLPYTSQRNSEIAMEMAPDMLRFVLDRPIVAEPGSRWTYNGGCSALLGHLIAQGTRMPLTDFAREKLFEPLGIRDPEWILASNGEPSAASGLRMLPRDLAKIGQLVLDRGRWGGRQLVPAAWLDASFTRHAATAEEGLDYGYQWWLGKMPDGQPWIAGMGNGGQRLTIIPSLDLVAVVMAGNYNLPDAWKLPTAIMTDIILPALK
jgi:CubicO group peptidase (beta-lactamase class C family)